LALSSGTRLGPYEILSPLGAGGMGEVYRARDSRLDRDVAVKVLPESLIADGDALARFEREAKAVAALSHPNILAIHDFGREGGIAYAVMELLAGQRPKALAMLEDLNRRASSEYIAPFHLAFLHIPMGNVDEAVSCLERACEDRNALTWWIRDCPFYDPIRAHPRFPALLEKIVPA
jgi:hypothetical protein